MVCLCCRGSCARELSGVCRSGEHVGFAVWPQELGWRWQAGAMQTCSRERGEGKTLGFGHQSSSRMSSGERESLVWWLGFQMVRVLRCRQERCGGWVWFRSPRCPGATGRAEQNLWQPLLVPAGEPGGCTSCCPDGAVAGGAGR